MTMHGATTGPHAEPAAGAPLVHALWTGGWDSTFRVLEILHGSNAIVQPWYVVDPKRPSRDLEVRTTEEIRAALAARRPDLAARIRPMVLYPRADIPEMPAVSAMWQQIRDRGRIGAQYDWLSRLARHEGLSRLEIGIQGAPDSGWAFDLAASSRESMTPYGTVRELVETPAMPELELFRPFVFNLVSTVKLEMLEVASRLGFADLLELTWFCAEPHRGQACGLCHPCQQALAQRLGRRMPLTRRIIGRVHARVISARRALKKRRRGRSEG